MILCKNCIKLLFSAIPPWWRPCSDDPQLHLLYFQSIYSPHTSDCTCCIFDAISVLSPLLYFSVLSKHQKYQQLLFSMHPLLLYHFIHSLTPQSSILPPSFSKGHPDAIIYFHYWESSPKCSHLLLTRLKLDLDQ